MSAARGGGRPVLAITAGFTAWSVLFLALYGAQATGCRLGWHETELGVGLSVQRAVLVALLAAGLAGLALLWTRLRAQQPVEHRSDGAGFLAAVASQAGLAALGAAAFCFAGVLWLTAC